MANLLQAYIYYISMEFFSEYYIWLIYKLH